MKPVLIVWLAAFAPLCVVAQGVSLEVHCLNKAQQDEFLEKARAIRVVNAERRYVQGPFVAPVMMLQEARTSRESAQEALAQCRQEAATRKRDATLFCEREAVTLKAATARLVQVETRAGELQKLDEDEATRLVAAREAYPACEGPVQAPVPVTPPTRPPGAR